MAFKPYPIIDMTIKNSLLLLTAIGGLTFGVSSLTAHCGSCGVGDSAKEEHSCPADCEKECCAESGHALVGEVVSIDMEKRMVMVKHEEIPGFMGAMTMGCSVPETYDLENLTTGCRITARVIRDNDQFLIKLIEVTEPSAT
jgi:Cu/Ag efflux protein CusF